MRRLYPLALALCLLFPAFMVGGSGREQFARFRDYEEMQQKMAEEEWEETMAKVLENGEEKLLKNAGFVTIAIDGGAGAGKTSTARSLAHTLGYAFVATGEHYRTVTHHCLQHSIDASDESAVEKFLRTLHPTTLISQSAAHFSLDGGHLSLERLRSAEINGRVSDYARLPCVRSFLHRYQKQLPLAILSAGFPGMVVEGRDVTTAVFPDATLRVYLWADLEERERRRAGDGESDDVADRDRRDQLQLQLGDGVWLLDTTQFSLEDVVDTVRRALEEVLP